MERVGHAFGFGPTGILGDWRSDFRFFKEWQERLDRTAGRLRRLHDNGVAIQIVDDHAAWLQALLIDKPGNSGAGAITIVTVNNHAALNQVRPQPIHNIFGRLIHIYVDMTETEGAVFDEPPTFFGKNALQYPDASDARITVSLLVSACSPPLYAVSKAPAFTTPLKVSQR